jgi:hypothetical protein
MLVAVAIKLDEALYIGLPGQRHHHLLNDPNKPFGFFKPGIQGFVDEFGTFYDRYDAAVHAKECGQIKKQISTALTSEDLW